MLHESVPTPDTVGPYRIECLLGSGGMGDVYQAFDPRLDRRVAIKHIRPEYALREGYRLRLEREAKTIASLDHPAVVKIFDVIQGEEGGEWIVMEFVDGPTVHELLAAGPLDVATAIDIALHVIHGLEIAHSRGVLHRDLKTENVMVTRGGTAKILDFGLAKRLEQNDDPTISVEGKVLGTARVMSPEQANGQELDGRSDLFSFGVLLYEMVTGRAPFRGSTPVATILKAFGEPHRDVREYNLEVPDALADLIDHLLEKKREDRPANAQEVAAVLEELAGDLTGDSAALHARIRAAQRSRESASQDSWLDTSIHPHGRWPSESPTESAAATRATTATLPRLGRSRRLALVLVLAASVALGVFWFFRPAAPEEVKPVGDVRIVVLPFENHGPAEREYFAAGLTSELIRELTGRRGLAVVSYRTSRSYASIDKKPYSELGSELGISYVVEGDVTWAGDSARETRLRISLRLVRVSDGEFMVSKAFDRSADDMLRVQSEIADLVSLELGVQMLADTRRDLSPEPRALDAYFHGIALWHGASYSLEILDDAVRYFEAAVESDPDFVRAWTELVRTRSLMIFNGMESEKQRTEEALERALELAPTSPWVQLASGYYHYYVMLDLPTALAEFRKAAENNPENPEVQVAIGLVLRRQGKFAEAREFLERGFDLDRGNAGLASVIGETLRARRSYALAEKWYALALSKNPDLDDTVGERAENILARYGCGDLSERPDCAVEDARRVFESASPERRANRWMYEVHVAVYALASSGDPEDFLAVYDSVPESELDDHHRFFSFWRKVLVLRQMARPEEADLLLGRYLVDLEASSPGSKDWFVLAPFAVALALQGSDQEAQQAIDRILELGYRDAFSVQRVLRWAATVAILSDRPEDALQYLREMSEVDGQTSLASYELQADPLWQPLRESGALQEIFAELRRRESSN